MTNHFASWIVLTFLSKHSTELSTKHRRRIATDIHSEKKGDCPKKMDSRVKLAELIANLLVHIQRHSDCLLCELFPLVNFCRSCNLFAIPPNVPFLMRDVGDHASMEIEKRNNGRSELAKLHGDSIRGSRIAWN